jgi:hypothetical protein
LHKLWVVLRKGGGKGEPAKHGREHANIVLAPSTGLEALAEHALDVVTPPVQLAPDTTDAQRSTDGERPDDERGDGGRDAVLEAVGCTLALAAGDVAFFEEDVYHRTQDLLAERVALLVNVHAQTGG